MLDATVGVDPADRVDVGERRARFPRRIAAAFAPTR